MTALQLSALPRLPVAALGCSVLAGCAGSQSALDTHGDKADRIAWLFWVFTGVSLVVLALVLLTMVLAIRRRKAASDGQAEHRLGVVVGAATAATVVTLVGLTMASYVTSRHFGTVPPNAVRITLTAKQWWWEAEYEAPMPAETFATANEIHVPVGRPVTFTLQSEDVIHSFWVPNLAGKQDLIPGRTSTLTVTASKPGFYRGQCAEFCGWQHAHMALLIVAEEPSAFAAWRARELKDAASPADARQQEGLDVVLRSGCVACHAIRGTPANGNAGPDLTHVAARRYLAAGTLPNTRGNLQGWIADPQGIKPGANMPRLELSADELNAVSDYLEALK